MRLIPSHIRAAAMEIYISGLSLESTAAELERRYGNLAPSHETIRVLAHADGVLRPIGSWRRRIQQIKCWCGCARSQHSKRLFDGACLRCDSCAAFDRLPRSAKRSRWTVKIQAEAIALYLTPMSMRRVVAVIEARHGKAPTHSTVEQWVHDAGVVRSRSRALAVRRSREAGIDYDAVRDEARRLFDEMSWSVNHIAKHLGVSHPFVSGVIGPDRDDLSSARIKRYWVADLPGVDARRAQLEAAIAMRQERMPYNQIAKAVGRPRSTVRSWFQSFAREEQR